MEEVEILIDGEHFVVSSSPPWTRYYFAWINGPADGTYGFVEGTSAPRVRSPAELTETVRRFIEGSYEPGGNREEDFPDHVPASRRTEQRG